MCHLVWHTHPTKYDVSCSSGKCTDITTIVSSKMDHQQAETVATLRTQTRRSEINGVATDVAVTIFVDRIFIAVTQLGTFGTLVEAYQKDSISGKFQPEIHVRLGRRDDPLLLVYARQILEHFGVPLGLPVVAALGIKDRSSATFELIMKAVEQVFNEARTQRP